MQWLKHAFAVDAAPPEPPPEQLEVVEQLCREIVRRGMTPPALAFLEMSRPLNYLGAQALHFLAPFTGAILSGPGHRHFAAFLERRDAIDRLCICIERQEREMRPGPTIAADGDVERAATTTPPNQPAPADDSST